MEQLAPVPLSLGRITSESMQIFQRHSLSLLLLCSVGVGFDALVTYGGGLLTLGYGEPVFMLFSTILQEVLYYGAAVLVWNEILRARGDSTVPAGAAGVDFTALLSGFSSARAWTVAVMVTLLYVASFTVLACIGLGLGGFLAILVPGAVFTGVKLVRTIIGPVIGLGYLATAVAVARPTRGVGHSLVASVGLMLKRPLVIGLVLSVGGFLEEAAGMTVVFGIALDAFLLCYVAAVVRGLLDLGELEP